LDRIKTEGLFLFWENHPTLVKINVGKVLEMAAKPSPPNRI
jgi:hypothetical protein